MDQAVTYHQRVPRDLIQNLRFRLEILERARTNERSRQAILHMCRSDVAFWIATFGWQFNPRKKGAAMIRPYIPWDFQTETLLAPGDHPNGPGLLWCIQNGHDEVIEKSRDMGVSYLCLFVAAWQFLFHPPTAVLCVSRSADAVDKSGDHKCLFWKLDFILNRCPQWMLGGYDRTNPAHRQRMLFSHPNGSSITGEASTEKAGVGGRATWMFIDEFSQIREARELLRRTAGTTDCRIYCGTHKGVGTPFHELTDSTTLAGSMVKKRVLHWSLHPEKKRGLYRWSSKNHRVEAIDQDYQFPPDYPFVRDGTPIGGPRPGIRSPWYDKEVKRIGDERGVAEDLDINPSGSVSQVFDPVLIHTLIQEYAKPPLWTGELLFDDATAKPIRLEANPAGNLKLWIHPVDNQLPKGLWAGGADISEGVGATPTCLSFASMTTGEKVLEYTNGRIEPKTAANLAIAICRAMKNPETGEGALFAWEHHGPGRTFGLRVIELGYRNVYYRSQEQTVIPKETRTTPGWYPSPDGRSLLLREYHTALRERKFINRSEPALKECLSFELDAMGYPKHAYEANPKNPHFASLNHGDHVVADALAWKMIAQANRLSKVLETQQQQEITQGMLAYRMSLRRRQLADTVDE